MSPIPGEATMQEPAREETLQAMWFAGGLPELRTEAGLGVEVLDPGQWNRGGGPDFLGAWLRIGGRLERGPVEVHLDARDWERHGHARDAAYRDVLLHVTLASGPCAVPGGVAVARHSVVLPADVLAGWAAAPGSCRAGLADEGARARLRRSLAEAGRRKLLRRAERLHRDAAERGGPAALLATVARSLGQPENGAALEALVRGRDLGRWDDAAVDPGDARDPSRLEALLLADAPWAGTADSTSARYRAAVLAHADGGDGRDACEEGGGPGAAPGGRCGRPVVARWRMGGTRPLASPWRRLAGLAALLGAVGGPSLLHEELERLLDARVFEVERLAARFVRRDPGYWSVRTRPGPATLTGPAALVGADQARTLVRDAVLPFFLERLQARGDGLGLRAFWLTVERMPAPRPDGAVRFVLGRMGEPCAQRSPLVVSWLEHLGAHWYYRAACGAGHRGCEACPWGRAAGREGAR